MKQKHKRLFLIFANTVLAFLMLFANPLTVSAQATPPAATPPTTTVDHTPKPAGDRQISITNYLCTPQGPDNPDGVSLFECINRIYRFSLVAAFFLAVLFIASAGYMYMSGGEKGKEKAKSIISSTFVAIVILTTSFILLRQINPDLVTFQNIQPLEIADVVGFDGTIPLPNFNLWREGSDINTPSGSGGTSYGGKSCSPITNDASPASVNNLSKSCFGQYGPDVVKQASIVASSESGGNPSLPVGAGSCGRGKPAARCTGGEIPVWGLYQINLTVHKVGGLDCPAAFGNRGWTCSRSCTVTDKDLYNRCVDAAKNAANNIEVACRLYQQSKAAGRPGFWDWGNSHNEHGNRCGF